MPTKIKDKCCCLDCNNKLPATFYYYKMFGNYCRPCLAEVNTAILKKISNGKNLRQRLIKAGLLRD